MNILVITNLYPPQELGGYGRSIADFVWGLQKRGHEIQVLTSNSTHLGTDDKKGPNGEPVDRHLKLKGTYEGGVKHIDDQSERRKIDEINAKMVRQWITNKKWGGILIGNLDLIGPEIINILLEAGCIIQHHVGFVHAPFPSNEWPNSSRYRVVAASNAVKTALSEAGLPVKNSNVIYPGARCELFEYEKTRMKPPLTSKGTKQRPLKICFAGLLMSSKGVHTLVEALVELKNKNICFQANIAGDNFQSGYQEYLQRIIKNEKLEMNVHFTGKLNRESLARFYALHHVGVFPSIHPEAFGIVSAEMMAAGLAVVSSGVGGAKELIRNNESGMIYKNGDSRELAKCLERLASNKELIEKIQRNGIKSVRQRFSVDNAAAELEEGFRENQKEIFI